VAPPFDSTLVASTPRWLCRWANISRNLYWYQEGVCRQPLQALCPGIYPTGVVLLLAAADHEFYEFFAGDGLCSLLCPQLRFTRAAVISWPCFCAALVGMLRTYHSMGILQTCDINKRQARRGAAGNLRNQTFAHGKADKRGRVFHLRFADNVLTVGFDGALTGEELVSDFTVS
jgi:hypothetical protein